MADAATAVREALLASGFTMDGVLSALGADAFAALGRGEQVPAGHALAEAPDDALTDLIRVFLLGESVPRERLSGAIPLDEAAGLHLIGMTEEGPAEHVRGRVHIQPYPTASSDAFVVSDFPAAAGRGLKPDHVIGVGGASVTLATITPREAVGRTLDLGTGCGIQALLARAHSTTLVATDRSERALQMASLTAALSDQSFDLRAGSLFEPVADEAFDLIVANPPFVISPHARFTYRDAPLRADDLSRSVVAQAAEHLNPGGIAVVLANWLHTNDGSWHERLAGWAPVGCQVWAAQRERLTAPEYVELWLRDSAEHGAAGYEGQYAEWLTYLDDLGATGVGFGWIVLRRSDSPWFVAEDVSDAERLPTGAEVLAQLADFDALHDATAVRLLAGRPRWRDQAELHVTSRPSAGAAESALASGHWRPAEEIDPVVLDILGGSGSLADRIAEQAGDDPDRTDALTIRSLVAIRRLIGAGLIAIGR